MLFHLLAKPHTHTWRKWHAAFDPQSSHLFLLSYDTLSYREIYVCFVIHIIAHKNIIVCASLTLKEAWNEIHCLCDCYVVRWTNWTMSQLNYQSVAHTCCTKIMIVFFVSTTTENESGIIVEHLKREFSSYFIFRQRPTLISKDEVKVLTLQTP